MTSVAPFMLLVVAPCRIETIHNGCHGYFTIALRKVWAHCMPLACSSSLQVSCTWALMRACSNVLVWFPDHSLSGIWEEVYLRFVPNSTLSVFLWFFIHQSTTSCLRFLTIHRSFKKAFRALCIWTKMFV